MPEHVQKIMLTHHLSIRTRGISHHFRAGQKYYPDVKINQHTNDWQGQKFSNKILVDVF